MSRLQPGLERLTELHRLDPGRPLALLELVRYAGPGGREDYARELARLGGRLQFRSRAELQFIGSAEGVWDDFLIVGFRSRAEFVAGLTTAPDLGGILTARRCYAAHPVALVLPRLAALATRLLRALRRGPRRLDLEAARARLYALLAAGSPAFRPEPAQLEALLAGPADDPIVMFNLLAYRKRAHYDPRVSHGDVSGREAYRRYARGILPLLLGVGGRPIWLGRAEATLVGEPEPWDEFAVVEYPSRAAFLGMVTSAAYQSRLHHRDAGLSRTELVQCAPEPPAGPSRAAQEPSALRGAPSL